MRLSTRSLLAIAALVCGLIGCNAPNRDALTVEQRRLNDESFDYVWETVRDRHFDPNFNGLDWDAMRDEYQPQVANAENMNEARRAMRKMLGRLEQTHFGIIAASAYASFDGDDEDDNDADAADDGHDDGADADSDADDEHGDSGIEIRVLEGQAIVTAVHAGSPGESAGVKTGWALLAVNGRKTAKVIKLVTEEYADSTLLDLILSRATSRKLRGDAGDKVDLRFLDGSDKTVEMSVVLASARGQRTQVMAMPEVVVWIEHRKVDDNIGYIAFTGFFDPDYLMGEYVKAMNSFMSAEGVIIDLRGNGGGIGGLAMGMAGLLIEEKNKQLGIMYLRNQQIRFTVFPRAQTFSGPVAVLTDGLSASTSEIFAGGLQDLGRGRVFGTRTAGAALPSAIERLPNGDGFQYAIANYISSGGEVLEGVGVIPDESVKLTRSALLAGQDPVLQAAITWIQSNPQSNSTN